MHIAFIVLFFFFQSVYSIDQNIDPDSVSFRNFKKLFENNELVLTAFVEQLSKKDTVVCDCFEKMNDDEKKRILETFLDQDQLEELNARLQQVQKDTELHVYFSDDIPQVIQDLVEKIANKIGLTGDILVKKGHEQTTDIFFSDSNKYQLVVGKEIFNEESGDVELELTYALRSIKNKGAYITQIIEKMLNKKHQLDEMWPITRSAKRAGWWKNSGKAARDFDAFNKFKTFFKEANAAQTIACNDSQWPLEGKLENLPWANFAFEARKIEKKMHVNCAVSSHVASQDCFDQTQTTEKIVNDNEQQDSI